MARRIVSRLRVTGTLIACGPLHVGGAEGSSDVDLALAVNGRGEVYLPGTSLAGPLRGWLREMTDERKVNQTWGFQEETSKSGLAETATTPSKDAPAGQIDKDLEQGFASFVFVEDSKVKLPSGAFIETRDGVGIDRELGAAAEHVKYNRQVLPAGTEIALNMTIELKGQNDPARDSILAVLHALQRGKIRFGAGKTRGLGRVTVKDLEVGEQQLLSFRGMLSTLRKQVQPIDVKNLGSFRATESSALEITIQWMPRGPVMVKSEGGGVSIDMLPLVSARGSDLTFVLPGSSLKGALRSQAERIIRTVCGFSAPIAANMKQDFMRQIEMASTNGKQREQSDNPAALLIGGLFGVRGKTEKNEKERSDGGPLPGRGALAVDDCYATLRFTPAHWAAIESAPDICVNNEGPDSPTSPLRKALHRAGLAQLQQAFHVAIDRWTGGAADGFLYTVLEPHGVSWEPIRMTLDLSRLRDEEVPPAVMCLLLTLRDLVAGRIPLGFGVNRGMGSISVTGIELSPQNLNGELSALKDVRLVDGRLMGFSDELKRALEGAWASWLNRWR